MSNPIKHHYVPQCYLKKFSLDKNTVKFYDKKERIYGKKEISEICQLENLYSLSQSETYYIETTFFANNNEDKLAKILAYFEKVDNSWVELSYDKNQRKNLSKQLILQYKRTPLYRDIKSEYELNAFYKQLKCLFEILNFEVEEIEYKANNKAEFHKTLLLEEMEDTISNISEADWELLYTSIGEFYTSDNPVVITHREDMPVTYCDAINFFKEIYYPLNSSLLLHITAKSPASAKKLPIHICKEEELLAINKLIVNKAARYVIYLHQFK